MGMDFIDIVNILMKLTALSQMQSYPWNMLLVYSMLMGN